MKIKLFFILIIFTMVLALQANATVILISSFEDLCKIGQEPDYPLNGDYELTQNIDASPSKNMNDGRGFIPIGTTRTNAFIGSFNGNGHIIKGLYINGEWDVGLFGVVEGGKIQAVGLEDVLISGELGVGSLVGTLIGGTVTACYSTGEIRAYRDNVGGLIGNSSNSTIVDCYSTARVLGGVIGGTNDMSMNAGGLVGAFTDGTITNCYFTGTVEQYFDIALSAVGGLVGSLSGSTITRSYSTGNVYGFISVGGLVGGVNNSQITNCYSNGAVIGLEHVGGLVGTAYIERNSPANSIIITNCYSTGYVSVIDHDIDYNIDAYIGGLVGLFSDGGTVTNCFWNIETSGQTISAGGGEGHTTANMKRQITYAGWNFSTIWQIDEGEDYPYLLSLGKTQTPTSVIESKISRSTTVAPVPLIIIKNKTLTIKSTPNSELQIRLFDMRGKTLFRFNTRGSGSNSFSLAKIPAGRYLIETKENGKRVGTVAIVLR